MTPPSVIPTTSQLLSLLASNPNIRSLVLRRVVINDDGGNDSTSPVLLCRLETLILTGDLHHVFPILRRLELPEMVDDAELWFYDCKLEEANETIRPYIRNYLRRDPRFKDRLGVFTSITTDSFLLHASTASINCHILDGTPQHNPPHVSFQVVTPEVPWKDLEGLCIDTLALLPRENVVRLEVDSLTNATEEIITEMSSVEHLRIYGTILYPGFLMPDENGPNPHQKLFPSLRWLGFVGIEAGDEGWSPLVTYLAHQTSGNQALSIEISGEGVHICADVLDQIYELVGRIDYIPDPDTECPSGECPVWEGGALII